MADKPQTLSKLTVDELRTLWLRRNHGVLTRVSAQSGLSVQFVREIFRGQKQSKAGLVEQLLAEAGCPGFPVAVEATGPSSPAA